MPPSLRRVVTRLSPGRPSDPPPVDERTLLQVLIGAAVGGLVAGLLSKLLGSEPVEAIVFGVLIGLLFLGMDLRGRRGGPPPPAV